MIMNYTTQHTLPVGVGSQASPEALAKFLSLQNPNTKWIPQNETQAAAGTNTHTLNQPVGQSPVVTNTTFNPPITTTQPPTATQPQTQDWWSKPPAWLNDMQSWWSGMQQQQQMPSTSGGNNGYVNNAFPQYTPNYGENALMRPITPNSSITGQNQYGNMGFNNKRSSLWGDW